MKKVEAVVGLAELEPINAALVDSGFDGVTVAEVWGRDSDPDLQRHYRGQPVRIDLQQKIKIEIAVCDDDAGRVVDVISNAADKSKESNGSIFVYDVYEILRIRNQQRDEAAI